MLTISNSTLYLKLQALACVCILYISDNRPSISPSHIIHTKAHTHTRALATAAVRPAHTHTSVHTKRTHFILISAPHLCRPVPCRARRPRQRRRRSCMKCGLAGLQIICTTGSRIQTRQAQPRLRPRAHKHTHTRQKRSIALPVRFASDADDRRQNRYLVARSDTATRTQAVRGEHTHISLARRAPPCATACRTHHSRIYTLERCFMLHTHTHTHTRARAKAENPTRNYSVYYCASAVLREPGPARVRANGPACESYLHTVAHPYPEVSAVARTCLCQTAHRYQTEMRTPRSST